DALCAVEPVAEAEAVDACRWEVVPVMGENAPRMRWKQRKTEGVSVVSATDAGRRILWPH
ncbi:hypothetical protein, partial [Xanthomonas citri]|uniref:hypothetical protein n=1 Tax=Xanthomonas citri TaxID=346 RepID=UPI001F22819A